MAKRSKKKKPRRAQAAATSPPSFFPTSLADVWIPLLLAVITFLVWLPSLRSDFVYDARTEILEEGFITSPGNLPTVLSLKVLGSNLMLGTRPGQLLYFMLIAAVCGKAPFGYHLGSNLLHAANAALLFVLLRRLLAIELPGLTPRQSLKAQLAAVAVTLLFALHPITVEPVSSVSYSSDLLVTFFTLTALLAATSFRPEIFRVALFTGGLGTLCAFAAVTCKESGLAVPLVLIVYWFLFRRTEPRTPWLWFMGCATIAAVAFLVARFFLAPATGLPPGFPGESFFSLQPRLWVFMLGQLLWPVHLSADYTLQNITGFSLLLALVLLLVVTALQLFLATQSRIAALGFALYVLGLAGVSNLIPLYRPIADRFYYLPLAGIALQLLALVLFTLRTRIAFTVIIALFLAALLPLTLLTLDRQKVFANEIALWTNTLQVSPTSAIAHNHLGNLYVQRDQLNKAITEFQQAVEIEPGNPGNHCNLGAALFQKGRINEAIAHYQSALDLDPYNAETHNNLGNALLQTGQIDPAIAHYQRALQINPAYVTAHNNLGWALLQKGQVPAAITQFQQALQLDPTNTLAQNNLAQARQKAAPPPSPSH